MVRKTRIAFEGAIYHVMARGNGRARIFHTAEDYGLFLKTLEEGLERFSVDAHAYCLMPNHFHLALRTPKGNLPRFMAWLQTTFTVRYNHRHRRSGHLFQGRYRAELVEDSTYGKWLVLYIHLNPVRRRKNGAAVYVGTFEDVNRFRWSSHRDWIGARKAPLKGLKTDWLAEWGKTAPKARKAYLENVRKELLDSKGLDWKTRIDLGLVAGGEKFLKKVEGLLKGKSRATGGGEGRKLEEREHQKLFRQELEKEKDSRLKLRMRVKILGESQVDLAKEFGYASGAGVYLTVRRLEERSRRDPALSEKLDRWKDLYSVVD